MEIKYKDLGFKCGIEIHQQIEGKKLFCNCPTINSDKGADVKVTRKLRTSASELGKIDAAAQYEFEKGKYFLYESNSEDTCLVEYDEEPPQPVNKEALQTALEASLLLNAKIVDEIQFMRKIVIDGSNTTGFQRTALVARNGYIDTSKGRVTIPTICLEEEAAQKIETAKDHVQYRLDRLGIPLIEIGTDATIKDNEHAKEVASFLGMVLRSTGKVKRGLGTIRQDLNVSIIGHPRVEIKGFQDLRAIPKTIENEIHRQIDEIKHGKELAGHVRKAEADFTTTYLRPMPGADRMYPETDILSIVITKEIINEIKLPELIDEIKEKISKKYGIDAAIVGELLKNKIDIEAYHKKFKNVEPKQIANILVSIPKDIKTRLKFDSDKLTKHDFDFVLDLLDYGKVAKEAVTDILVKRIKGEHIDLTQFAAVDEKELEKEIESIIKSKPGLSQGAYMGMVMAKFRGKVDGKKISDVLKRFVK